MGSLYVKIVNMFSTIPTTDFKDFATVVFFAKVEIAPLNFGVCGSGVTESQK